MSSLKELSRLGSMEKFEQDEHIFYQGEKGYSFYIILKGEVLIYVSSEFDGNLIELSRLKEGQIFGEMALISQVTRSASVKATQDVVALKINQEHFNEFISLEPKYAVNMLKTLASRYYDTLKKLSAQEEQ